MLLGPAAQGLAHVGRRLGNPLPHLCANCLKIDPANQLLDRPDGGRGDRQAPDAEPEQRQRFQPPPAHLAANSDVDRETPRLVEHPGEPIDNEVVFAAAIRRLRDSVFEERRAAHARQPESATQWEEVRARLQRALDVLADQLVALYMAGTPDMSEMVFTSTSWSDLVSSTEYAESIQDRDEAMIQRVTELRNEVLKTENNLRRHIDNQQNVTEKEKRFGMRAALRQYQKQCSACKKVPTTMKPTSCGVCGNF